jgi:hypothetical protein
VDVAAWDRAPIFRIDVEIYNSEKINFVALTAMGLNPDEFKSGGLHVKHAVATWKLGTMSAW